MKVGKYMENKAVKKLFYELLESFPNGLTKGKVESIIKMQEVREHLTGHGFLYKEGSIEDKSYYGLGANGMNLIATWNTEDFTKKAMYLAFASLIVSAIALAISLKVL